MCSVNRHLKRVISVEDGENIEWKLHPQLCPQDAIIIAGILHANSQFRLLN